MISNILIIGLQFKRIETTNIMFPSEPSTQKAAKSVVAWFTF